MASAISHVAYAQKALRTILKNRRVKMDEYIRGTCFPDIRYIAGISRQVTHYKKVELRDLLDEEDDFVLGWLLHLYTDSQRERIVGQIGLYTPQDLPMTIAVLKFIEDTLTYPKVSNWKECSGYFKQISPIETSVIEEKTVRRWHDRLSGYFQSPPDIEGGVKLIPDSHLTQEQIEAGRKLAGVMLEDRKRMEKLEKIYELMFED